MYQIKRMEYMLEVFIETYSMKVELVSGKKLRLS